MPSWSENAVVRMANTVLTNEQKLGVNILVSAQSRRVRCNENVMHLNSRIPIAET